MAAPDAASRPEPAAAIETEKAPQQPETRETGPVIPDQAALDVLVADNKQAVDQAATDVIQDVARMDAPAGKLGLSKDDADETKQELGVDAQLGAIQGEIVKLKETTKAEMDKVSGGAEKGVEKVSDARQPDAKFFDAFGKAKEKMSAEKDRNAMLDQRAEAAALIKKEIPDLTDENAEAFIKEFNEKNPGALKGMELTMVRGRGDKVLMVDENGGLKEIEITKENAADALKEIKAIDAALDRKGNSHELRQELLKRSEGKIKSTDAYTYATDKIPKGEVKDYLDDPENWVPERQRLHEEIVAAELQKAVDLAERMGEKNTIFALRGNTAAGKTTALKSNELFKKAINPKTGQPDGAINPDTYKTSLKAADAAPDGWQSSTHFQTHEEGSMLARSISKKVEANPDASMIIDKRLNEKENISELVEKGKKLKFLDVDSPLETSLVRVLGRKAGGGDPLVPFDAVAEGFEGVKKNRAALIQEAIKNPNVDAYVLYAPGPDGKPMLIAEKVPRMGKDGQPMLDEEGKQVFTIDVKDKERFVEAVGHKKVEPEIDRLRGMTIDDAYIEKTVSALPKEQQDFTRANLAKWKGKTFEQALNEHAKEINEVPPSVDYYKKAAMRNLETTSRTAKGTVDTSASKDKAGKMAEGLTGENAAELAKNNFTAAVEKLFANKETKFDSPAQVKALLEDIATTINGGLLKEGELLRTGADSDKFKSYTKTADVPAAFEQFAKELQERMNDPDEDPKELAAWAEYRIDLTDHFFADGCGKTAKAISSFILMRADQRLPNYTTRAEYYQNAPTEPRAEKAEDDAQLKKFTAYYNKLVPAKTG